MEMRRALHVQDVQSDRLTRPSAPSWHVEGRRPCGKKGCSLIVYEPGCIGTASKARWRNRRNLREMGIKDRVGDGNLSGPSSVPPIDRADLTPLRLRAEKLP